MVKKLIEFTDLPTYLEIAGAAKTSGKNIGMYIEYLYRKNKYKKISVGES